MALFDLALLHQGHWAMLYPVLKWSMKCSHSHFRVLACSIRLLSSAPAKLMVQNQVAHFRIFRPWKGFGYSGGLLCLSQSLLGLNCCLFHLKCPLLPPSSTWNAPFLFCPPSCCLSQHLAHSTRMAKCWCCLLSGWYEKYFRALLWHQHSGLLHLKD